MPRLDRVDQPRDRLLVPGQGDEEGIAVGKRVGLQPPVALPHGVCLLHAHCLLPNHPLRCAPPLDPIRSIPCPVDSIAQILPGTAGSGSAPRSPGTSPASPGTSRATSSSCSTGRDSRRSPGSSRSARTASSSSPRESRPPRPAPAVSHPGDGDPQGRPVRLARREGDGNRRRAASSPLSPSVRWSILASRSSTAATDDRRGVQAIGTQPADDARAGRRLGEIWSAAPTGSPPDRPAGRAVAGATGCVRGGSPSSSPWGPKVASAPPKRSLADSRSWHPIRLGHNLLRVETAGLAGAAIILARCEERDDDGVG